MGGKIKREIAIVEGRELNQRMTDDLINAAKAAGFNPVHIRFFNEYLISINRLDKVFPMDMVLWRSPVEFSSNVMVERVLNWLNKSGKITMNTHSAGGRSYNSNKFYQHGLFYDDALVREHTLKCFPAISKKFIREHLVNEKVINFPFVLKPNYGTRGLGIILIHDDFELDKLEKDNLNDYCVEEYVESKYDWRAFVLGGVTLGIMRKVGNEADPGDFEAKSGGRMRWPEENQDLYEEISNLAVHAASACGIEYAGVDIIRDDKTGRLIVLETNICGGWQNGFVNTTGVDVATETMQWFSDKADLLELKTNVAVQNYVEHRIKKLSRSAQEKYQKIMNYEYDDNYPRDMLGFGLESEESDLKEKLKCAYLMVRGRCSEIEAIRVKSLLKQIETYEISRYGGFIGKDSGSLDDSIEETAYYLAISAKM